MDFEWVNNLKINLLWTAILLCKMVIFFVLILGIQPWKLFYVETVYAAVGSWGGGGRWEIVDVVQAVI